MITCYNPNTYCRWDSNQDGSDDNILNLSQDEIMKLPNIGEVVDFYHSVENNFINAGRWNSLNLNMPSIDMFKQLGLNNPHAAYSNDGSNEDFIVSRLDSGRFALKPNLKNRPFLY